MKKDFVIINMETKGFFSIDDDKQIIFIEAIKVDERLNKLDEFKAYIKPLEELSTESQKLTGITNEMLKNSQNEKEVMLNFSKFCENSNIITHNARFELSFILKALYKNNVITNFEFKYLDIRDILKSKIDIIGKLTLNNIKKYYNIYEENNINSIFKIVQIYLKDNDIANLSELFWAQPFHGKVFRGLNYAKYLCDIMIEDNKYYGYIVDFSCDKYVSYYAHLKEINNEYFSIDEIKRLKEKGAKIIMNVGYLKEESLTFTDYYMVQADAFQGLTADCSRLINGINNFVKYNQNGKKIKLVLWGTIKNLRNTYGIIDEYLLEELISLIDIIKEPWDYWFNFYDLLIENT